MIDHGYREVSIAKIVLPGDFNAWRDSHWDEIWSLDQARRALVLAHAPVVEKGSMKLVAGRRRIAALLYGAETKVFVHLVSGTARELQRLTASENLHRGYNDDRAELARQYVEDAEAEVEQERAEKSDARPRKPGRPQSAKGEARERAARDLGTTPEALRKAESRAEAKTAPPPSEAEPEPPIVMHGLQGGATWMLLTRVLGEHLDEISDKLKALTGRTGQISHRAISQSARLALQQASAAVRALRPYMACVFCRDPDGSAGRRAQCSACGGEGWLTHEQAQRVPPEQLLPDAQPIVQAPPAVAGAGDSFATVDRGWPAPRNPPAKRLDVRLSDGTRFDTDSHELEVERDEEASGEGW